MTSCITSHRLAVRIPRVFMCLLFTFLACSLPCHIPLYSVQLLHCRRFSDGVRGGESTFLDGFLVAEELRRRRPDAFATLLRVPATFQKIHYARASPAHIVCQREYCGSYFDPSNVQYCVSVPVFLSQALISPLIAVYFHGMPPRLQV